MRGSSKARGCGGQADIAAGRSQCGRAPNQRGGGPLKKRGREEGREEEEGRGQRREEEEGRRGQEEPPPLHTHTHPAF